MTEAEAIKEIKRICKSPDHELAHIGSESVLMQFLIEQGFEDLAKTYEKLSQNFYYA